MLLGTKRKVFREFKMNFVWVLPFVFLCLGDFPFGDGKNVSSRPAAVHIGAIFSFDSTIGRVANFAIDEAVKDINSNPSILHGTKLLVEKQNSNCSGFLGMIEGTYFYLVFFYRKLSLFRFCKSIREFYG